MKGILFVSLMSFLILGQVPVSCFPDRRNGHSEAENISRTKACPHLQNNPGEKIVKLRPFMVDQRERLCCGCGKGQRLVGVCNESSYTSTRCEDCPPSTYMDLPIHFNSECFVVPNNLHCSDDELYIPYTATSKPECRCRDNHYRSSNGTCLPHTACGFGKGVKRLGNHNSDTVCEVCGEHFESNLTSSIEKCRLKESVHNHPKNVERTEEAFTDIDSSTITSTTQESYHTQATSNQNTFSSSTSSFGQAPLQTTSDMIAIYIAIGLVSGIVFAFLTIFAWKKKTKIFRKKTSTKVPGTEDNSSKIISNQKENIAPQNERLLNETSMNDVTQTETERKRKSFIEMVQSTQRLRRKSCEIIDRKQSKLTSFFQSNKPDDDDESEPTSSNNLLSATNHEQEKSSESSDESKEENQEEIEKDKEINKKMNDFKMFLADRINLDETKDLYRRYSSDPRPEIFLDDCERRNNYEADAAANQMFLEKNTKDIFHAVWSKLEKCRTEEFNPKIVRKFFISIGNKLIADEIKDKFPDLT